MVPFAWGVIASHTAAAADRADVKPGALTFKSANADEDWTIAVLGRGMPLMEKLFEAGMCRITYTGKGSELISRVRSCPDALRDEVVPASKYWLFDIQGDITGAEFDVWYMIDGRGITTHIGPTRLRVEGDEMPVMQLVPKAVEVPEWPAGQTLAAECRVTVTLDKDNGHAADVQVSDEGCPSGYVPTVATAARKWEFEPISSNNIPVPLAFEAIVRFAPPSDGSGATIDVDLPVAPDVELQVVGMKIGKRELPSGPPIVRLHHRTYADVLVYGVGPLVPGAVANVDRRCEFLMQVNSAGRTWLWPERCPEELHDALQASRQEWTLVAGKPGEGEAYARFRGIWDLPAGSDRAVLRLPEQDVVSKDPLPPDVSTYAVAEPTNRVPPKLPRGYVLSDPQVCQLDVTINRGGHVTAVVPATVAGADHPGGCAPELLGPAAKSASRWRWTPAASDGEPFESHASVRVRFGGGA